MFGASSGRLPGGSNHVFSEVPRADIPRSQFNRSHSHKTTFDAGYLIPIFVDEALPGDTFNCRFRAFARLNTPLKPIMDNMYLDTFFFFVPNRLLWTNWEKFCGAQTDPGDSIAFTIPRVQMPAGGPEVGSLWDYFGIPTDQTNAFYINALHSRAYNLIYTTWFRDQNLQDSLVVDVDDGADTIGDYVLRKRCKRPDYFTTCRPWASKGPQSSISTTSNPLTFQPGGDGVPWSYGSTSLLYSSKIALICSRCWSTSRACSAVSRDILRCVKK